MTRRRTTPLGCLICDARTARGWSLRELAARLGVSPAHLSDVETGRRAPSEDMMRVLLTGLDVPDAETDRWHAAAGIVPESLVRALLAQPDAWARIREVLS